MYRSVLMDLSITLVENVFYRWNKVSNYNLQLQSSHIKLKLSIYSFVPIIDQLTPMGFILSGASRGTQIMLEYKDSNYTFRAPCLK